MSLIWYIYSNDIVSGPFSTENVETGLQQNRWSEQSLIWWKGQREWLPIGSWRDNLKTILDALKTNVQTMAWYVEHLGTQKGPMNSKELLNFVQTNGILGNCRVWSVGMERWMGIFELPELVSYFGITRRRYPRAPLKGDLVITKRSLDNETYTAHAGSISVGGMGIRGLGDVQKGDSISVELKSPLLVEAVKADAVIVYSNAGGYTGLEFQNLSKEHEDIISDYVNQFKS